MRREAQENPGCVRVPGEEKHSYKLKPKAKAKKTPAGQVMLRTVEKSQVSRGRYLLTAVVAVCAMGLLAGKAVAITPPTLGITMTHVNAYGDQAKECAAGLWNHWRQRRVASIR